MAEDDQQVLKVKIAEVLRNATQPMTPQEIAHLVGFGKPNNQAATVNPTLWKMVEANEIIRTTKLNGNKPRYAIATLELGG